MKHVLIIIPLLLAAPLLAGGREERTWGELAGLNGRTVRLAMPAGAVISGRLTAIEPDGLVLQIQRTTDKQAFPRGRFVVPRSSVKLIDVISKGKRYRVIGTICGAWIGLSLGTYAAIHMGAAGAALATLAGVGGGLTTAGYLLGDAGDKRVTTVVVRQ